MEEKYLVREKEIGKDKGKPDVDGYEWEQIDSCWGYYEEPDEVIRLVIEEHDLKETA